MNLVNAQGSIYFCRNPFRCNTFPPGLLVPAGRFPRKHRGPLGAPAFHASVLVFNFGSAVHTVVLVLYPHVHRSLLWLPICRLDILVYASAQLFITSPCSLRMLSNCALVTSRFGR